MAFKFVLLFATLAAVNCGVLQPAGVYQHTEAILPQAHIVKQAAYTQAYAQPAYAQQAYAQQAYAQPAYAQQAYIQPAAAVYKHAAVVKQVVHEEPANYEFNYDVHDTHTGDIKQQNEKAVNGVITGQYSLIDADGYRRIVDYTADDHHGFNANVRREPLHQEQHKVIKTVQPVLAVQKIIAQPAIAVQKVIAQPAYNNGWQQPNNGWQAPAVQRNW